MQHTPEVIIKKDNHQEDTNLVFDRLSHLPKKGVIHLGAHKGEEVDFYLSKGYQQVILLEANPELCDKMTDGFRSNKNVNIFNYAVCDKNGEIEFHIHESRTGLESSSIFKMDEFDKIVTTLKTAKTLKVPAITIDNLVEEKNIDLNDYNVLVSDIQGADYFALKGAAESVKNFDAVIVEVQCISLYENFITEKQFDELMESYGFYKDFIIYHELYKGDDHFPAWGEVVYLKK